MIYLDTAALVKLVRRETASDELVDWLNEQVDRTFVSSALVEVELPRALRRTEPALLTAAPSVLAQISVYDVDETVRTTAAAYQDPLIRSLDAIHLATADAVLGDDLTAFVTYDRRLLATANAIGLPTVSPGLN
ncbi:type II toxin-antitoxin system VapC family toxin [Kribbella sp. NPDC049174]|uniref:type II toxin-antitoxin system VapC family toxin n=1 Tax=Kribbella sp. NPDC049174 TaxID=3364112 RepID=UPI00371C9E40